MDSVTPRGRSAETVCVGLDTRAQPTGAFPRKVMLAIAWEARAKGARALRRAGGFSRGGRTRRSLAYFARTVAEVQATPCFASSDRCTRRSTPGRRPKIPLCWYLRSDHSGRIPKCPKTRLGPSRCRTVVIVEDSAEPLPAMNECVVCSIPRFCSDQRVIQPW